MVLLVNLILEEMRKVFIEFCMFFVEDIYVVFYFVGYGFECGGLSYLMLVDVMFLYYW